MAIKEKIKQDLVLALKENKPLEVLTLRQLLAVFLAKEKEKRYKQKEEKEVELNDEESMEVVSSEAKKRKESIASFEQGERKDLADKERKELEILQKYLPGQLSEQEIKELAKEALEKTKAEKIQEMGKVMAELMPKTKGRAEGGLVSKIVKELLEKNDSD